MPSPPLILGALVATLVVAAVTPLAYRRWPRAAAWAPTVLSAALFAGFATRIPAVARGEVFTEATAWLPALGVTVAFRVDGLGLVFALLITGIGALVHAYSVGYMHDRERLPRLLALLLVFEASMLGLVLADDTLLLYVTWELTSISSFFLIAFDDTSAEARTRAKQALLITAAGGLALLVGVLLLASAAGGGLAVAPSALGPDAGLADHRFYPAIVLLLALAAFTKSAHVPFQSWLPGAMVAPTPVSAYLHSATMVKAGVYLLARFAPALGGTAVWTGLLVAVGGATAVVGATLAILQRDLKLTLAYATISVLGALTVLVGLGTTEALTAFTTLLLAHACYKAALFMVAGNVDHHAGSRDPFALSGLARQMPLTAAAAGLAALSMAGIPPLVGFIGKEGFILAALTAPAATIVGIAAVLAGALLVAAAWIAGFGPFYRGHEPWRWQDAPASMLVGPALLAALGVVLGVAAGTLVQPLATEVAASIAGRPVEVEVKLWHGIHGVHGAVVAFGALGLVLGTAAYVVVARRPDGGPALRRALRPASPEGLWSRWIGPALSALTHGLIETLQNGRLRRYVAVVVTFAVLAIGAPLAADLATGVPRPARGTRLHELALMVLAGAGAIATVFAERRFTAIAALGATGLAIAFLFAVLSAPDLAITQLMTETLLVILLVLVFRKLPPSTGRDPAARRAGTVLLAAAGGATVTLLLMAASSVGTFPATTSEYYVAEATAHDSTNIVNAILVDLRAIDTLGEVCVVAIAALGVSALLRLRPGPDGLRRREDG